MIQMLCAPTTTEASHAHAMLAMLETAFPALTWTNALRGFIPVVLALPVQTVQAASAAHVMTARVETVRLALTLTSAVPMIITVIQKRSVKTLTVVSRVRVRMVMSDHLALI